MIADHIPIIVMQISAGKPSGETKSQEVKEEKADNEEPTDQQVEKKLPEPPAPKVSHVNTCVSLRY